MKIILAARSQTLGSEVHRLPTVTDRHLTGHRIAEHDAGKHTTKPGRQYCGGRPEGTKEWREADQSCRAGASRTKNKIIGQPTAIKPSLSNCSHEVSEQSHPDYPLDRSADEIAACTGISCWCAGSTPKAPLFNARASWDLWASLLGQEAAQVGSGRALGPREHAFPTYREHGVAWCRGLTRQAARAVPRREHGGWDPNEQNFNLYTIVIGAQTLHAAGYAMGIQRDGAAGKTRSRHRLLRRRRDRQGDVNEAFIFARRTPRRWSSSARTTSGRSRSRPSARPGAAVQARAPASASRACGWTATTCSPAWRSPERPWRRPARAPGPTLIEAYTYRMGAHTTSDDPTRYRADDELEPWS